LKFTKDAEALLDEESPLDVDIAELKKKYLISFSQGIFYTNITNFNTFDEE
jgi:hypothetical protein